VADVVVADVVVAAVGVAAEADTGRPRAGMVPIRYVTDRFGFLYDRTCR